MFNRIRDRSDIIALVARDLTLPPAVRRACLTGLVEVLGGFKDPNRWILTVTTKHGGTYHVAVVPDDYTHAYRVRLIDSIPWHLWIGGSPTESYSIYQGDHPAKYTLEQQRRGF